MSNVKGTGRVGALVLLLVLGLTIGTLPASANHAPILAHVNIQQVLSGTADRAFTFTVNHPTAPLLTAAPAINTVVIIPPRDRILALSGESGGWSSRLSGSPPRVIFENGSLAAGNTGTFTVRADVFRMAADTSGKWTIQTSTDNGTNLSEAGVSVGESQTTTIRVLQVQQVAILSPPATTDNSVTSTQTGVCARMRVFNAGSGALDVTPSLAGAEVTPGPAKAAGTPPCSGANLSGGKAMIASGDQASFDFLLSFGSPTTSTLAGTASAPGASTPNTPRAADDDFTASISVLIQALKQLVVVANSLFPKAKTPGSTTGFEITVNTPQATSPGIAFDKAATTLNVAGLCGPLKLVSPDRINPGSQSNIKLTFEPCSIPSGTPDANFNVSFAYAYTDDNSHSFGANLGNIAVFRVDASIPDILGSALVPNASQVQSDPPTPPALTNNVNFNVAGDVRDTHPTSGPGALCGPKGGAIELECRVFDAKLLQYDLTAAAGGGPAVGSPIPLTTNFVGCVSINSSAKLQATNCNRVFHADAESAQMEVTVEDEAGLQTTVRTGLVDVDNIVPTIVSAEATRGPGHRASSNSSQRQVLITFSEPVQDNPDAPTSPLDWKVSDGTRQLLVVDVTQDASKRKITLLLASDWSDDPATGSSLMYELAPTNSRLHDRVGLNLVNQSKGIVDRIPPLDPDVQAVAGRSISDAKFWFNTETISVTVGNPAGHQRGVVAGYNVQVFQESNGTPGFQHGAERLMCQQEATGNAVTINGCSYSLTLGAISTDDHVSGSMVESTVYARTIDTRGNAGGDPSVPNVEQPELDVDVQSFVFDSIVPHIHGVTVAGTTLNVQYNEPLAGGRNSAIDWRLVGRAQGSGFDDDFTIGSVGNGATADRKTLSISDSDYSATVDLTSLQYEYVGPDGLRYKDRATNESPDRAFNDL